MSLQRNSINLVDCEHFSITGLKITEESYLRYVPVCKLIYAVVKYSIYRQSPFHSLPSLIAALCGNMMMTICSRIMACSRSSMRLIR